MSTSLHQTLDIALDKLGASRQPEPCYDAKGEPVGLVYYGEEAGRWYAVDLAAAQLLAETPGTYEAWCEATTAIGEGPTRDAALRVAGAFTSSQWSLLPPQDPAWLLEDVPEQTLEQALRNAEAEDAG